MTDEPFSTLPGHACQVLAADDIYVSHGAAQGDGLMGPADVCPGDIYHLDPDHRPHRLVWQQTMNQTDHHLQRSQQNLCHCRYLHP